MIAYFRNKLEYIKSQYNITLSSVLRVCISILFLSFFDSMMSYVTPIVMIDSGLSEFSMGLLYSCSSLFGFLLDLVLVKYMKTTHYRVTLLWTIIVAILFPICMFTVPIVGLFLIGMFLWGLYYNLWGFATADFTARESKVMFHVASASLIMTFHDIGYISGTLLIEPILKVLSYRQLMIFLEVIIVGSLISLLPIVAARRKKNGKPSDNAEHTTISTRDQVQKVSRVIHKLYPLLLLGIVMTVVEAVTWTITPIIDTVFPQLGNLGGVVLAVNFMPSFIAYGMTSPLTKKFGKKRVGMIAFIAGAAMIMVLGLVPTVPMYIGVSFVSSFFVSIAYASISGAYADYLKESQHYDNEIVSSRDMGTNIGYIIGPMLGGFLLTYVNSIKLFTYLGASALIFGLILFAITPKKIPFHDRNIES